jgi:hypothetical protein
MLACVLNFEIQHATRFEKFNSSFMRSSAKTLRAAGASRFKQNNEEPYSIFMQK